MQNTWNTTTSDQPATVVLRPAQAGDEPIMARLAALDSAPRVTGAALLASIDGRAVAALSLLDRRVVADPFVSTQAAVDLLRLRAEQMAGGPLGRDLVRGAAWWKRGRRRLRASARPAFA